MDVDRLIGRQVRAFRRGRGWSLDRVCARLDELGVPMSTATLSRIETGGPDPEAPGRRVTVRELLALAIVLEVPPPSLVTPIPLPMEVNAGRQWQPAPPPPWEPIELSPAKALDPMMGLQWFVGLDEPTAADGGGMLDDQEQTHHAARPYDAWVRMWVAQEALGPARRDLDRLLAQEGDRYIDPEDVQRARRTVYVHAQQYERAARDLVALGVDPPLLPDEDLTLVARALGRADDYAAWKAELQMRED